MTKTKFNILINSIIVSQWYLRCVLIQHFRLFNVCVHVLQEMVRGNRYKTLRWRFVESLEPPRVVHARCPDMISKGNLYGQVTLRVHSRQVRIRLTIVCRSVTAWEYSDFELMIPIHLSDIGNLWPLWPVDAWGWRWTQGRPGIPSAGEASGQPLWALETSWQDCSSMGSTKRTHY